MLTFHLPTRQVTMRCMTHTIRRSESDRTLCYDTFHLHHRDWIICGHALLTSPFQVITLPSQSDPVIRWIGQTCYCKNSILYLYKNHQPKKTIGYQLHLGLGSDACILYWNTGFATEESARSWLCDRNSVLDKRNSIKFEVFYTGISKLKRRMDEALQDRNYYYY